MQNYTITKKYVVCIGLFFCGASLFSNIIDGYASGTIFPYDLRYNSIVVGSDLNQSTSVLNELLTNLSGTSRLMTYTASSKLYLRNTTLVLDGNYTFSHGSIEVAGEVKITGSGNIFTFAAASLLVDSGSCLTIGPGVTFQFAPTGSWSANIVFQDNSSSIKLIDATLLVNNAQGMVLTGGRFIIEGLSTVDNTSTLTTQALFLGTEYTGTGDCVLVLEKSARLNIKNAGIVWRNQGSTSFNTSDGTICVASEGKFLTETPITLNGQSFCYDSSMLTGTAIRSSINSFGSNIAVDSAILNGYDMNVMLPSPDNQYLLLAGRTSSNDAIYQYIEIPSFTCGNLITLPSASYTIAAADWSSDGNYVALGVEALAQYYAGSRLILHNFKGLNSIETIVCDNLIGFTGGIAGLKFSPNGKYLALYTIDEVSITSTSGQLKLFSLDAKNQQLTPISSATQTGIQGAISNGDVMGTLSWSPDGNYVVIGTKRGYSSATLGTTKNLLIWKFDGSTTSTIVTANLPYLGIDCPISWSPCGKYFAVGSSGVLFIYYFDGYSLTLVTSTICSYTDTIVKIEWSSDGKYIIVGITSADNGLMFYQYTSQNGLMHLASLDFRPLYVYGMYLTKDSNYLGCSVSGSVPFQVFPINYNYTILPYFSLQDALMKLSQNTTVQQLNVRLG